MGGVKAARLLLEDKEMIAYDRKVINISEEEQKVTATIYSDGMPSPFPTSGADVDGMLDTDEFAVGTKIVDTTSGNVAMYGEDGQFHEW